MLPLYLLTAAKGQPTLVELKSGESINGVLVEVDTQMNVTLNEAIETSADGEKFLKLPEIFVRGKDIKYIRLPDEIIAEVKAKNSQNQDRQRNRNNTQSNTNDRRNNRNYNNNYNNRNYNNQNQNRRRHNNQQHQNQQQGQSQDN